ncbi:phospholipid-transporting ATPase ABCA3-like [Haliotis cracherodii]|uniref:phospholipid-transporting ATPase ABCA3-like n=1 Tax=Haliotis cracherodii TaxID=6455 RepID=UPI0039EA6DF1
MGFFKQLGLLMWKNWLLQKRKVCVTVFEIILPLLFAIVLLMVRFLIKTNPQNAPTVYSDFSVNSNGTRFVGGNAGRLVLYTPNSTMINALMDDVQLIMNQSISVEMMGFSTEEAMLNFFSFNSQNLTCAVQFNVDADDTSLPQKLTYAVRPRILSEDDKWRTRLTFPFFQTNSPRSSATPDYKGSGFLWVQRVVNEAIIKTHNSSASSTIDGLDIRLMRMPYPPYIVDPMIQVLQTQLPIFLLLSFILCTIQTTKGIVYEKEKKLKESMKLMGLSAAAHWMSWFLTVFIYIVLVMAVYTLLCGISISANGPVLAQSDPSLLFVFLLCYGMSVVSFCFMISVFANKANVGAAIAGILFFFTYFPYFFLQSRYETMSRSEKLSASILLNMAMAYGANVIALYEGTGAGAQWNNFTSPATVDDNYSLLDAMVMLLGDTLIHLVITWYVDNVRPGEFGVPKPWYFPFTGTYWCGAGKVKVDASDVKHSDERHFEKEPNGLNPGVCIKNLSKVFGSGSKKKVAVNGMNLNMYEGQISVLLGHNGAGKTTTMSVLTGFIPPSGGTALVNGHDIRTDIQGVRQSLGLCPQHNILFDTLTVVEHMEFFADLKGCKKHEAKTEVDRIIHEVGLDLKRHTQSQHLSGGQKRKLSVGIALIGGSKIVILDEPTSGMDPAARRQTWDILQRNRQGRTMLLTTHFMDEADLLGDRIAIMAEGVVKCCGTSYFLKKLYGAGYHLVMVKEPTCQVASVTAVVQQHVPTAVMESEINAELSYLLPDDQSAKFAALFTEIENKGKELGICSFGTTATTMEEVFLKVGESQVDTGDDVAIRPSGTMSYVNPLMDNPLMDNEKEINGSLKVPSQTGMAKSPSYGSVTNSVKDDNFLSFNKGFKKATGIQLELSRFKGCFVKKALHTWRNRLISVVQLVLPVIATILALVVEKTRPGVLSEESLVLDLSPFGGSYVPYQNGSVTLTESFAQSYIGQLGSGDTAEFADFSQGNMTTHLLSRADQLGVSTYNKRVIIGAEYQSETVARGYYNGQPFHAAPISLAYMMNGMLKSFTSSDYSITTQSYPLPKNVSDASEQNALIASSFGFTIAFNILFGMAFLTSSFVYFLIKERQVGSKHLQVVSGVGPFVFWMSNLAWDFINYIIPCLVLLPVFAAFQTDAYVLDGRLGLILLVFIIYGWSVLPFMYLLQYMFKTPATGMVIIIVLNILSGLLTLLATFVLMIPGLGTEDVGEALDWIFSIVFPHYCLGKCFSEMYVNKVVADTCIKLNYESLCDLGVPMPCCKGNCGGSTCLKFYSNYLEWDTPGIGRFIVFMLLQGCAFITLTLCIEYQIPQRVWYALRPKEEEMENIMINHMENFQNEDNDVAAEKQRVEMSSPTSQGKEDALVLRNLYKRYGNFVAVDHISVGIPEKECFGLLGQNGAGKTTTFKMLTGDVMVTNGNAYLWSYDIKQNTQQVQENMGYCPQFDALIEQMTGRETLTLYARLKGVPESCIEGVCDNLLDIMMLKQYGDRPTGNYSGGNKRKLSTAIALVGDPAFIMLDEPSTGMDPKARRQLWNVLSKVRECGRTLILTSHSMEECDALCTRIAIMVNGRFVCLGTPQHLKNKFGQGYTLIARMGFMDNGLTNAPTQPLIAFIKANYPHAQVFDDHQGYAHFQIPDASVRLAQVFSLMENTKSQFSVEDYSVHQTTLEQVFLTFTRTQNTPKEDKTSFCKRVCCC